MNCPVCQWVVAPQGGYMRHWHPDNPWACLAQHMHSKHGWRSQNNMAILRCLCGFESGMYGDFGEHLKAVDFSDMPNHILMSKIANL